MNFVETREQIVNIGQIVQRCPNITLMRAFTRSYRDWACQTQYLRVPIAGETAANVRLYDLGSDPYVEIVAIYALQFSIPNGPTGALQYWSAAASDSALWNPNINPQQPLRYSYVAQAQVAVDPIPDKVYNTLLTAIVQPKETATSIPETGLVKYRSAIEAGALGYLLSIPAQPWTSITEAARYRREFQSGVNNARAEVQRGFNTGSVRVRPRNFT